MSAKAEHINKGIYVKAGFKIETAKAYYIIEAFG